jgi:hypothetical protein
MSGQRESDDSGERDEMLNESEPIATLDPHIQEALGKALRAYCDDIVTAPIPDKFLVLLAQLEAKERASQ